MAKELKILPVRKLKDSRKKVKIDPILPQVPFLWCLSAGVGQGKSNFLINICRNPHLGYDKVFKNNIVWISPTINNDDITWSIRRDESIIKISEDLENVGEILESIIEQQKEDDEQGKKQDVLVILDDMLGYLRTKSISKITAKFRHWRCSLIMSVQNFRALPVCCRYNTQYWCIWHLNSKKELGKIEEEMEQVFPDFLKYYEQGTRKRYSFIYCDMKKQIIRENFGRILYQKTTEEEEEDK